jgi:hypothetical protein
MGMIPEQILRQAPDRLYEEVGGFSQTPPVALF